MTGKTTGSDDGEVGGGGVGVGKKRRSEPMTIRERPETFSCDAIARN
jgi:hypothetical protein